MIRILIAIFIVLHVANSAIADEIKRDIAKCAQINGNLQRLDCYDSLARTQGVDKPKDVTPTISGKGKWQVSVEKNPIDDTTTVTLALMADSGQSTFGVPIGLVIRCQSNETNLYIDWRSYLGNEASVLTRIGSEKAVTSNWGLSTDSQATFYPNDPIPFIKKMMETSSFVAQVTPYNENPITATFDSAGLKNAILPLMKTCHWK